jgi:hypothetical protein
MGTSSSYGGPGDKTPLLPSWALPGGGGGPGDDGAGDGAGDADGSGDGENDGGDAQDGGEGGSDGGNDDSGTSTETDDSPSQTTTQAPAPQTGGKSPAYWQSAKTQLGRPVSGRGGGRSGYGSAAKAYVRALGGSRRAASSGRSARSATRSLGHFLSDVRNHGLNEALGRIGLRELVGRDIHSVFAAVVDAIAPEGVTREEVAAREAVCQTLADLFGQFVSVDPTGNTLAQAMNPEGVRAAIQSCVVASAFNRWLDDLARQIETKAISAAEALKTERDIHQYIVDTVQLDFSNKDPLAMDWQKEGRELIDRLYDDAYRMLGGEQ